MCKPSAPGCPRFQAALTATVSLSSRRQSSSSKDVSAGHDGSARAKHVATYSESMRWLPHRARQCCKARGTAALHTRRGRLIAPRSTPRPGPRCHRGTGAGGSGRRPRLAAGRQRLPRSASLCRRDGTAVAPASSARPGSCCPRHAGLQQRAIGKRCCWTNSFTVFDTRRRVAALEEGQFWPHTPGSVACSNARNSPWPQLPPRRHLAHAARRTSCTASGCHMPSFVFAKSW